MKAYVIYLDNASKQNGYTNEVEEDRIADLLSGLGYTGEVRSELTGNTTTFEGGRRQCQKNEGD